MSLKHNRVTILKKTRGISDRWLLLGLVLVTLVARSYKITSEPLDWHAWRQADTASVTREYVKHGIDLLHPTYLDLSSIPSGKDNPEGYRMVEFPLYNAIVAILVTHLDLPLVPTSRAVSALFSLGTCLSLFYLVKHLSNKKTAYLSALIFAILPYSVFYSRAILPEPGMVFFSTLSFLGFYIWLKDKNWGWFLTSFVAFSFALLLKPSAVFLFPVYPGLILFKELPIKNWTPQYLVRQCAYYLLTLAPAFLVTVAPLLWWRNWIAQFPEGIPAYEWLLNSNGIRFRPAWFRWLIWERLTKLISGYIGILFFPFNFLSLHKDIVVYASWWLGVVIYVSVIATGNVQHDYYQVMIVPIICISIARGSVLLYDLLNKKFNFKVAVAVVGGWLVAALMLSWQQVKGYFNINHPEYIIAGQTVDRLTPPDALVIAPAMGDTQFLYQTNRRGWPFTFEIEDQIKKGADYYVTTSFDDEAKKLENQYQVVEKTNQYILIDLTKPAVATNAAQQSS